MKQQVSQRQFVICVRNEGAEDLAPRKIYEVLPDESAARSGYLRIIDESGEDYLYPSHYFVTIELSQVAQDALRQVA